MPRGRFHSHEMVNQAIAHRLRMVSRSGLFSNDPRAETLGDVFARLATTGGFVVFDLAEMSPGRLRALASGLNHRLKITNGFLLVVAIDPLPEGFPATGVTRSFWTEAKRAA